MGRINFGRAIKDFKGITGNVTVTDCRDGHDFVCDLKDWQVYSLPDELPFYENMGEFLPIETFTPGADGRLPRGVYRGTFNVDKPADTFLDFSTWGKGLVYVNGHALGRIWEIGPQQTLYMPGCWLKKGENQILVFDILGPEEAKSRGLSEPILDSLKTPKRRTLSVEDVDIDFNAMPVVAEGEFAPGNGWQEVKFAESVHGRYLAVEALDGFDDSGVISIAELHALNGKGERLSREPWTALYADSEQTDTNRTADKVFDLQESTYWSSNAAKGSHAIIIDLGDEHTLTGVQYLPRMEKGAPGAIRRYRLHLLPLSPLQ